MDTETVLIRKQREEIILLTNELQNQETQLNSLNESNKKLKMNLKSNEEKFKAYEISLINFEKQIKDLKDQLNDKDKELEANRIRLHTKEAYFNKQSLKFQQSQFSIEKLNQEMNSNLEIIKELKIENSKLNLKCAEQSNRYKETKLKLDELMIALNNKKDLLDNAKEKIKTLESNLSNFIDLFKMNKCLNIENLFMDEENKDFKINNYFNYFIQLVSKLMDNKHDSQLNSLLQSLKAHWFEANVVCEQIKSILGTKYKDITLKIIDNSFTKKNDSSQELSTRQTSTPVNL